MGGLFISAIHWFISEFFKKAPMKIWREVFISILNFAIFTNPHYEASTFFIFYLFLV